MMRTTLGALLLASLLLPFGGGAHRFTEKGNRYYEDEQFDEALNAYTEAQLHAPEAPELYYDIGNVLYRQGDYIGAEEAFARALGGASPELAASAAYNLGNALFRQERYQDAAREYRRALELDPSDPDAKRNLELALRQLRKQQQPQQRQTPQRDSQQEQQEQQQQGQDPSSPQPDPADPQQQEKPSPQPNQPSAQDRNQAQPEESQQPAHMTPDEAKHLLDTLAAQERENLHRQALRRTQSQPRSTEEDW